MSETMGCPCCDLEGTLAEIRAHLVVQADVGEAAHEAWLAEHGIDLADDRQRSVSELTELLEIHVYSGGGKT